MPDSCVYWLLLAMYEMYERNGVLSIPQEALKQKLWVTGSGDMWGMQEQRIEGVPGCQL
jgi:hypothetical protein